MESTVVQSEIVQSWSAQKKAQTGVFRWQKYVDGEGKLWIVVLTHGFTEKGIYGANVELLDVDSEFTVDVPRAVFDKWVQKGNLKRVESAILI